MSYQCDLKELPAQPTLHIRMTTAVKDLPQLLGKSYDRIIQHLCNLAE